MEAGCVPLADVRRRSDRRAGLHGEERLLEIGGNQPGDLAVATHCSPLANNERGNGNGNGINDSTNANGTGYSKSYSPVHRIQRVSTSDRRYLAAQRSYGGLLGCRGSVFAAAECVDQKIGDSVLRAAAAAAAAANDAVSPIRVVVERHAEIGEDLRRERRHR